jgi:hypothetical protein
LIRSSSAQQNISSVKLSSAQLNENFSNLQLCLELCTVSKHLGSKVKTLFGVLADLCFFLIILSFFMVAYGVSVQSIIYTNEWRYYDLFFGIFVRPFFSMFGELFLGEITSYQYSGLKNISLTDL